LESDELQIQDSGPPRLSKGPFAKLPPHSAATNRTMRTFIVVFVLALITIAFEVYSDAALTSGNIAPRAAPDPTVWAVYHGLKRG
jgi:hypothetical protein